VNDAVLDHATETVRWMLIHRRGVLELINRDADRLLRMRRLCPKFGEQAAFVPKHKQAQDLTCAVGSALGHAYIYRNSCMCTGWLQWPV
jgi:hypothetical protein